MRCSFSIRSGFRHDSGIENRWFAEQPFEAGRTTRRGVESGNEGIPFFRVQREGAPVGQPLFRFAQRRFENKLADGSARSLGRSLQSFLGRRAEAEIKFLGSGGASKCHSSRLDKLPDNVNTNKLTYCIYIIFY